MCLQPDGHRDDSHQHYKASAVKLKHAIDHINAEKDNVEFVLNMGDIIDGNATQQATTEDLEVIGAEFDRCVCPFSFTLAWDSLSSCNQRDSLRSRNQQNL